MNGVWGVMQGRFTNKGGFYPQQFPWSNWEQEFGTARGYGIDCIEWMFNGERYEDNPIWTKAGRRRITEVMGDTGVAVYSVCANFYMENDLSAAGAMPVFERLLDAGEELGVRHIVLPLFGASEVTDTGRAAELFERIGARLLGRDIKVCFESDIPMDDQFAICDGSGSSQIGICYDLGNAAGNGYDCISETTELARGGYYLELHLKDKKRCGSSVMFGQGSVDFSTALQVVEGIDCLRVFEGYFGFDAIGDTARNIDFIQEILDEKGVVCRPGQRGTAPP